MAKDIIEETEPYIRKIVRICRILEAEGRGLDELNDLMGRMSKLGEHSQPSIKGIY
jgi:hypothetical protein